ncbi:MAG TPA: S8 family serine peptidase [Pyrinomonadaceae bacterium]|jgi:hypothetical protein
MVTRKKSPQSKEWEGEAAPEASQPAGERELIVIANPQAGLRAKSAGITSEAGADVTPIAELIESEGIRLEPLFGLSEERIKSKVLEVAEAAAERNVEVPDLSVYYRVDAPDARLDELAEKLRENEAVEAAYVKPAGELPQLLNDMVPAAEDAPPTTPDFTSRQRYLDAAPVGIDARYAWTLPGGRGAGVNIIDLEWAWRYSHEDLLLNQGGVVGGTQTTDQASRNHGTAVIGVIGGDGNTIGITGICPDARVSSVAFSMPTASAIRLAADRLSAGDIMLLEIHRAGPRFNFQARSDQRGYIAIEWWPDDFDAIRYAIGRGVIVVEAGGNGAENLDDAIYSVRPAGFPSTWTNPFNRSNRDSGAIVVGAGNPPAGTHGRNSQPNTGEPYVDRARCGFSNFGAVIDTQGWGWEVTSTGYGDLQGGNENEWYTDQFSGTSSASPVIVGALGCVQGVLRARGRTLLTPATARQCLRSTGSPQQDATGRPATQRIGNRPNLRQLIECADPKSFEKIRIEKNFEKSFKREIKELKLEVEKPLEKFFDKLTDVLNNPFGRIINPLERLQFGPEAAQGGSLEDRISRLESMMLGTTQAPESQTPAPVANCIDFTSLQPGNHPNPLSVQWATFLVRGQTGARQPNTRIVSWGGIKGLDCGYALEIKLNHACPCIQITLAQFSRPATVYVFNADNSSAGSATMTNQQATPQTLMLCGTGIVRIVVKSPQNEVLLLKLCCVPQPKKTEGKETIKAEKNEKLEKLELKEQKSEKIEKREGKETIKAEKLELKEKIERKEIKDKDLKEFKEGKEIKEVKEKDKEIRETGLQTTSSPESTTEDSESVEQRLAILEQVVTEMVHFISPELRPDLGAGALTYEEDQGGNDPVALSQQLQKDAADAKQAKDNKDVEKLSEY